MRNELSRMPGRRARLQIKAATGQESANRFPFTQGAAMGNALSVRPPCRAMGLCHAVCMFIFLATVQNSSGQSGSVREYIYLNGKVIAVESGTGGGSVPGITITSPTSEDYYNSPSNAITLSGGLSGTVDHVAWTDDHSRGSSCTISSAAWTCGSISVPNGDTVFVAAAYNGSNAVIARDSVTVRYSAGTSPTIAITSPTSGSTGSGIVTLEGTALDDVGVTAVKWRATKSGKPDRTGACVQKFSSWSEWRCPDINLYEGANTLYAVACDGTGNTGTASLDINYAPPGTPPPTPWLQSVRALDVSSPGPNISVAWYIPPSFNPSYFAVQRMYMGAVDRNLVTTMKPANGQVTFEDLSLPPDGFSMGKTYTYRVAACSAGGCGSYSNASQPVRFRRSSDDDMLTDISVWTPSSGVWLTLGSKSGLKSSTWGMPSDKPLLGDYDSDGKTDIAVWRPGNGIWYILKSGAPGAYMATQWGLPTDLPVPGDYDGDGPTDIAVWRPGTGVWYAMESSAPGSYTSTQWGLPADIPMASDYDGDLKTDIAVWRPGTGTWYILPSTAPGNYTSTQWGLRTDIPVAADYDGDRKTDIAVWRPDTGVWYILPSTAPGTYISMQWGLPTDIPVPADYDNDGRADAAIWRSSDGVWYYLKSSQPGTYGSARLGASGDVPLVAVP